MSTQEVEVISNWLNFIDVAFVLVVLLSAWGGFQQGFARQLSHILTFLLAGILLFFAYPYIYSSLGRLFRNIDEEIIMWALMAGLVILSIFAFIFITRMISGLLKKQIAESTDHVYGMVLGMVRGTMFALLFMIFIVMLGPQHVEDTLVHRSRSGRFVCLKMVPRIRPHLSRPIIKEKTRKWQEFLLDQEEAGVLE